MQNNTHSTSQDMTFIFLNILKTIENTKLPRINVIGNSLRFLQSISNYHKLNLQFTEKNNLLSIGIESNELKLNSILLQNLLEKFLLHVSKNPQIKLDENYCTTWYLKEAISTKNKANKRF